MRNEKAKRFLMNMRRKPGVQLENYFPRADRGAVALLKRMLVRTCVTRLILTCVAYQPFKRMLGRHFASPARPQCARLALEDLLVC